MEKKILESYKLYNDERSKIWQEMQETLCAFEHFLSKMRGDVMINVDDGGGDGGVSTAVQFTMGADELDVNVDDDSQEVSVQTVSHQILMMTLDQQNDHVLMVRDTLESELSKFGTLELMKRKEFVDITKMEDKMSGIIITPEQDELGFEYKIGILQFLVDILRCRFTAMVDSFEGMKPTLQQSHIWDGGTI